MKNLKILLAFLPFLAFSTQAFAAEGSIGLTPGTGTNYALTAADGSGFFSAIHALCGGTSATMGIACANQAEINSSGQLLVTGLVTLNTTPSLANGNGVVQTQGGTVLSATNGVYSNILQGNAVLSATNPLFSNLSQGSAALSATNGIYSNLLQGNAVLAVGNPIFVSPGTGAVFGTSSASGGFVDCAITTIGCEADAANIATGHTLMAALRQIDADILGNADPCSSQPRTIGGPGGGPVNFTSATTTKIVSGNTGQNVYICELAGVPAGAQTVTLVSGTGTNCGTSTATIGGPWVFSVAGNGFDFGKGITAAYVTAATGQDVCVTTGSSAQIAISPVSVLH